MCYQGCLSPITQVCDLEEHHPHADATLEPGSGRGGPDPAFPLLFEENPASRPFFIAIPNTVFLSQNYVKKD